MGSGSIRRHGRHNPGLVRLAPTFSLRGTKCSTSSGRFTTVAALGLAASTMPAAAQHHGGVGGIGHAGAAIGMGHAGSPLVGAAVRPSSSFPWVRFSVLGDLTGLITGTIVDPTTRKTTDMIIISAMRCNAFLSAVVGGSGRSGFAASCRLHQSAGQGNKAARRSILAGRHGGFEKPYRRNSPKLINTLDAQLRVRGTIGGGLNGRCGVKSSHLQQTAYATLEYQQRRWHSGRASTKICRWIRTMKSGMGGR
jgi:hypothetical protein